MIGETIIGGKQVEVFNFREALNLVEEGYILKISLDNALSWHIFEDYGNYVLSELQNAIFIKYGKTIKTIELDLELVCTSNNLDYDKIGLKAYNNLVKELNPQEKAIRSFMEKHPNAVQIQLKDMGSRPSMVFIFFKDGTVNKVPYFSGCMTNVSIQRDITLNWRDTNMEEVIIYEVPQDKTCPCFQEC